MIPGVSADVGNNNRYETNSGSSYDSDGGDFIFIFEIVRVLIYFLFEAFGPLPGLILSIGLVLGFLILKKQGKFTIRLPKIDNIQKEGYNQVSYQSEDVVLSTIQKIDSAFSKDAFITWAKEVFIKIQNAWTKRDWRPIRPFESNALFSQHAMQLQEYIDQNKINKIEKVAIQNTIIRDFRQDGDKEVIVVELHAVMRDYVVDASTNKVLESDPNKDWHMKYLMTFNRKVGTKTHPGMSNKSTTNCPNCGAPTEITSAGQCPYCDSVITTGDHDWVLSDIKSIS